MRANQSLRLIQRTCGIPVIVAASVVFAINSSESRAVAQERVSDGAALSGSIRGLARNPSGAPVQGVSVLLVRQDEPGRVQATSAPDGSFVFSALQEGRYSVSAEKSGLRSKPAEFAIPTQGKQVRIDFTIDEAAGTLTAHVASTPAGEMEFSDSPTFAIAAVTDWTAAGGHGSDAILRTSEDLTRETAALKSDKQPGAVESSASIRPAKGTEEALRAALSAAPGSFEANSNLGSYYLVSENFKDAKALLETAYRLNPSNTENEYKLALALQGCGEFTNAREHVRSLLAKTRSADLLRLNGELEEQLGDPLAAVKAFEESVNDDPSEENYFRWGSELLLHRAIWQAKDVFSIGVKRYPGSARMATALGAALFACALYDDAARRLCEAADLAPMSPEPYLFLGKIELASPSPLNCVEQKLASFARLQPANPLAAFYYAMAIWKQSGRSSDPQVLGDVETLLNKTVRIDPKCGDAYLQLGILNSSRHEDAKAIDYYLKALDANPKLSEAHYRLGVAYDRAGNREDAKREFQLHETIDKQQAAEVERQRREIKQFLVEVKADEKPAR